MNSSVAKPVPDFSPRSDYLFPGQTPRDPVFLDIDRIADDAMRRVQAAVEETTAEAGAKAVAAMEEIQAVVEKTSKDADAKAQEALRIAQEAMDKAARVRAAPGEEHELKKASAEPAPEAKKTAPERTSWLAWLKDFLNRLIRRVVGAVCEAFGATAGAIDSSSVGGGGQQILGGGAEGDVVVGGTANNAAVADLVLDEISRSVDELCKDPELMQSLHAAKTKGPESLSGALQKALERLEGESRRLDEAVTLQRQAYQGSLEKYATKDMSALKMNSLLQKDEETQALLPLAVVDESKKLRAIELSHEALDRLISVVVTEVKVGLASDAMAVADEIVSRYPGVVAALDRHEQRCASNAAQSFIDGSASRHSGVGPVSPATSMAQKLATATSVRPKFGSGRSRNIEEGPSAADLGIDEDEPLERQRGRSEH